jgi:hypothetical protein
MHGVGLVTQGFGLLARLPDSSWSARVQSFAGTQAKIREEILAELSTSSEFQSHIEEGKLWTNYKLMEIFDQVAQYLCNRYPLNTTLPRKGPPNEVGNVPVSPGLDDTVLRIDPEDEHSARVSPYPFDVDPPPVSFSGRLVEKQRYSERSEFLRDYYKAPRVMIDYNLHA